MIRIKTKAQIRALSQLYIDAGKFLIVVLIANILEKDFSLYEQVISALSTLAMAFLYFRMGLQLLEQVTV